VDAVAHYFTHFLPCYAGKEWVPGLSGVNITVRFTIENSANVQEWEVALREGKIADIRAGRGQDSEIEYQVSDQTFLLVTGGRMRAEEAFLRGKVRIKGSILKGLKMAALLQNFFRMFPYDSGLLMELPPNLLEASDQECDLEGIIEEQNILHSSDGDIEVRLAYPEEASIQWKVVLAPPHPYLGATLDNPVIRILAARLAKRGCLVARFNYTFGRDLAEDSTSSIQTFWSTSDTENDMGVLDLEAVWEWLRDQPIETSQGSALIGYSYGAQAGLKSIPRTRPGHLVLISPVVSQIGDEFKNATMPVLLAAGDQDFATSRAGFEGLAKRLPGRVSLWIRQGGDHFFSSRIHELSERIEAFLDLT
jgi:alpha/beta superfamily hydrolase/putative sterol carrier protein